MNWSIQNMTLLAHDVAASSRFFGDIIGLTPAGANGGSAFGAAGQGLSLCSVAQAFSKDGVLSSKPADRAQTTLAVPDLKQITGNLEDAGYSYLSHDSGGGIYVFEPSGNLISFVDANSRDVNGGVHPWEKDRGWGLHHVNLQSFDVRTSIAFFVEIAEMEEGRWQPPEDMGDFSIDPSKLAILPLGEGNRGLHLIEPDPGFGHRNNFPHNPSIGGHPAFWVQDIHAVMKRLDEAEILYSDAKVYAMPGMHQIYVYDPHMNMIEVNQYV